MTHTLRKPRSSDLNLDVMVRIRAPRTEMQHSTTQYIQVLNNVNIPQSAHCRESYTIENRHNDIKLKRVNVSIFLLNLIFNKEE